MDETQYRAAERELWAWAGLEPTERRIRLPRSGTTVRVQEVGEGEPVVFVHGGPNSGSTWAPLVAHLDGFRCLLLDRPGTGLSDPLPDPGLDALIRFSETVLGDLLDASGLHSAHAVGSSLGGFVLLRGSAAEPERVERMIQMGCPAMVPGMLTPPFMRVLGTPVLGRLVRALPPSERTGRMMLRQIGHGASLDAGRFPAPFERWYLALQRHTDTMANDADLISEAMGPRGFHARHTIPEDVLSSVKAPTLLHWGADDTFGGEDVARRLVGLLPDAVLDLVPDGGHLPWLDDPVRSAATVIAFLGEASAPG
jgi:pimeloyl-ACP methyl ester carboxylesterase